jgi:hypothetical protein
MKVTKKLAGIRLTPPASRTVGSWARLTGKSVNWVASWSVEAIAKAMIDGAAANTAKEELQALSRVQSEMELSAKRVSAARAKLSDVRAGRHHKQAA